MQVKKAPELIRVIPQFTMTPGLISLIAEESKDPFVKGQLVTHCGREIIPQMERPLSCRIIRTKVKGKIRVSARPYKNAMLRKDV